jgi:competence protein ComEC
LLESDRPEFAKLKQMHQNSRASSASASSLYPLAWLAASFAAGIGVAASINAGFWPFFTAAVIAGVAAFFLLRRAKTASILVLLAFAYAGGAFLQAEQSAVRPDRLKVLYDSGAFRSGTVVRLEGTLAGEPELAAGGFFLRVAANRINYQGEAGEVSGTVRLFAEINLDSEELEYQRMNLATGDRIAADVGLKREDRYLNPGVRPAREALDRQGIDATGTVKRPVYLTKLAPGDSPFQFIYAWRKELLGAFQKTFNGPTAGVMIASLLGNKYFLDKQTGEAFREGGTFHILVISGSHITLLGALLAWLLSFVTRRRWRIFVISNLMLWVYTIAVGGDAPVTRAAVMFTILSFAYVVRRQGTLLNALGGSALMLLLLKPSDLFDPSFQLTFACVFAIVAVALPLLEKMRAIGAWYPTAAEPLPPNCSPRLKVFCEVLFWSERSWRREQKRNVWQCVLFKTPWAKRLEDRALQPVLRYLFTAILVSAIVQAWLLPFLVVYFHRLSLAGIFLNLFVGVLLAFETISALFSVLLAQLSTPLAAPFVWLTEQINWLMLHSVDPFDAWDIAAFRLPAYTGFARVIYVAYFLPLVVLWLRTLRWDPFELKRPNNSYARRVFLSPHFAGALLTLLAAVIVFHPFTAPRVDGKLRIDFLDVGQGDSCLLTFPDGATMLIDGGGRFNFSRTKVIGEDGRAVSFNPDAPTIGESVVSEFLWQRGLDTVDHLVVTHGDIDHVQGLADVARNFSIKDGFAGAGNKSSAELEKFYGELKKHGVPLIETARGDVFRFGEVTIEVLSPSTETVALSENNNSLVLRVSYGETSFLFTGDIEKEAEAALLAQPEKLRCDLIKVPHHGSHSSSTEEMVTATGARFAVISVGRDSPFGHPHREVVERWLGSGANTMTTGANGTITVISDGHNISLNSYLENQTHP